MTYKRGRESRHNLNPARTLDVAFLLSNEQVSWPTELLAKFEGLITAASAAVHWDGNCLG